jgi:hypothetical protein
MLFDRSVENQQQLRNCKIQARYRTIKNNAAAAAAIPATIQNVALAASFGTRDIDSSRTDL